MTGMRLLQSLPLLPLHFLPHSWSSIVLPAELLPSARFHRWHETQLLVSTFLLSLVNVAMTFIALTIMDKAGRRPLLMCTWVGMCCGFFTIYLTSTLGDVFGFFPTLMSNAQVRPRPEPSNQPRAPRPAP